MSCRVLKRGMENFTLNTIVAEAKKNGFNKIVGEFLPTLKNEMVKDHYLNLGFQKENNQWVLEVDKYEQRKCFIQLN